MLKPRGFVPWGLLGPTRGRRDAAASRLASKTKGTQAWAARIIMMGGGTHRFHRFHVSLSYAALRTALGIETDPW